MATQRPWVLDQSGLVFAWARAVAGLETVLLGNWSPPEPLPAHALAPSPFFVLSQQLSIEMNGISRG